MQAREPRIRMQNGLSKKFLHASASSWAKSLFERFVSHLIKRSDCLAMHSPNLRTEFRQLMLAGVKMDINIWMSGSAIGAQLKLTSSSGRLGGS